MAHTAVISNNKGGVAKTELTVQLAAALARAGKKVLVVDMDPQANATRRLGIEWDPKEPIATMSEVIKADQAGAGEGAVVACGWVLPDGTPTLEADNIDVLPARFDLINRETEAGVIGAVRRLQKALEGWTSEYDVILIDTRPDLGHLVQMSMAAADTIIIPTDPNYDSVEAAIRVKDFVARHAMDIANPTLAVGGVVVTRRKTTLEHDFQIEGLREHFGDLVWNLGGVVVLPDSTELLNPSYIPEWSRFAEADAAAVSLSDWTDRNGRKTVALYDAVARTYLARFLGTKEKAV
ncbi:ParA family protein [Cryobacterium zhongshanensis]|uniref:AAA family ATPase n=1 Tax=Cryobacterium zhongshanensis TaxID=2928153 RepID=A0AA41UII5_9MICO|nr:AAA family ATPase [Cryobacterium zhongshanensis]MCI4659559.1 AAA family ATPase [Cryobacterium zhongshanensis]